MAAKTEPTPFPARAGSVAPAGAQRVGTRPGDYAPLAVIVDECARAGFAPREITWSCRLLLIGYLVGRTRDEGILTNEERLRGLVRSYLNAVTNTPGGRSS